jgi:hypothetical protein
MFAYYARCRELDPRTVQTIIVCMNMSVCIGSGLYIYKKKVDFLSIPWILRASAAFHVHRVIERGTQAVPRTCNPDVCLRGPYVLNRTLQKSDGAAVMIGREAAFVIPLFRLIERETQAVPRTCDLGVGLRGPFKCALTLTSTAYVPLLALPNAIRI